MGFVRRFSVNSIVINRSALLAMSYSLSKLIITFLLLLSSNSFALGLSSLSVSSVVGERFYAVMSIDGVEGIPSNEIFVSLAPRSVYRTMGVEWDYFHSRLIFDVLKGERDQYTIRIVSSDVVFEPYLDFVILLRSPAGSILKQLTVLLDMPAITEKPFTVSKPAASLPQPKQQTTVLNKVQRTAKTETKTKANTKNKSKTKDKADKSSAVDLKKPIKNKDTATMVSSELLTRSSDRWSHKTQYGDSLWAVARRVQAQAGGSIKPIVDALYKNNPSAFINNDANRLKINARLAVSAAQIKAVIAGNAAPNNKSINEPANTTIETRSTEYSAVDDMDVLSLVTDDKQDLPVSAKTLELSERSSELADDYDKGLIASKARKLSVEDRIDKLYQQYNAIAEKTEQLKVLEQSLDPSVIESPQPDLSTDEAFTIAAEGAEKLVSTQAERPKQPKQVTDYRHLLLLIAVALGLLLLLVVLLKQRQNRYRALAVDNWDLANNSFNGNGNGDGDADADINQTNTASEQLVSEFAPDLSAESSPEPDNDLSDEVDVESKAAVYIAYERFDEAEDLLEQALEIDSDNESLQLQLLEVYAAKGKLRHFELLANQLADLDDDKITIKINYLASKL